MSLPEAIERIQRMRDEEALAEGDDLTLPEPVSGGRLRMKVVSPGRAQRRDAASSERAKSHRS